MNAKLKVLLQGEISIQPEFQKSVPYMYGSREKQLFKQELHTKQAGLLTSTKW